MYRFLTKYGTGVAFGVGLLATLIFLIPILSGVGEFNMLSPDDKGTTSIFNAGLYTAIALIILCFVISIGFGVFQLATNPKGAIKLILGIGLIGIMFFVMYSMASPETSAKMQNLAQEFNITDNVSKLISASLWTVIILAAVATGSFVLAEIRNVFK